MTILRMSVFVLSFALCAGAYSQTGAFSQTAAPQPSYKCSSGNSLKDGFLVYESESLQAVAKHNDGTIAEVSGILGQRSGRTANPDVDELMHRRVPLSYGVVAEIKAIDSYLAMRYPSIFQDNLNGQNGSNGTMNGMGMGGGLIGAMTAPSPPSVTDTDEAPDRDDIETTPTRHIEPRRGDSPGFRNGDKVEAKPGTNVGPKAGDSVEPRQGDKLGLKAGEQLPPKVGNLVPFRDGDRIIASKAGDDLPARTVPAKNGDLVMKIGVAFSAQLDSHGNITQITYRQGRKRTAVWQVNTKNSHNSNEIYDQLNSELGNLKSRAYCCTQNPGANCADVIGRAGTQSSLRSEKPSIGQRMQSAWSNMLNTFKSSTGAEAK